MNTSNNVQQIKSTGKEAQELIQSSLIKRIEDVFNAFIGENKDESPAKTQATENQVGNEKIIVEERATVEGLINSILQGEEKQLTLEDIEKMKAAAAGAAAESGFSLPPFLSAGHAGYVDSIPRDLGLPPLSIGIPEPVLVVVTSAPQILSESISPDARDDGFNPERDPFIVFESGLPAGSDLDPNNPTPPVQPSPIMVAGNILANDDLGSPNASITKINFGGQDFFPDANGIVTAFSTRGNLVVYTQDSGGHVAGDFTYTLLIDSDHPLGNGENELDEIFTYTITNAGGSDSAEILIRVVDDVPIAVDDGVKTVLEGQKPLTGNVLINDVSGADGPAKVIAFTYDGGQHTAFVPQGGATTVSTALGGLLTISSDGSWEYFSPINVDNTNGPVHDDFNYNITDSDADTSSANQAIIITDGPPPEPHDDGFGVAPDSYQVFESGLASGSDLDQNNPTPPAQSALTSVTGNLLTNDSPGTDPSSITIVSFNNVSYVPVNGVVTINTGLGILTVYTQMGNGHQEGEFSYQLLTDAAHPSGQGNNSVSELFNYIVTDIDGDSASANLKIQIVDDVPQAINNSAQVVVEGQNDISGNVLSNDVQGADNPSLLTSFSYNGGIAVVQAGGSTTVTTTLGGVLTVGSDGAWYYVSPASVDNSNGDVPDGFSYTITDSDGDSSSAIQPIAISDGPPPEPHDDGVGAEPEQFIVYESGLPSGSDLAPNNPNVPPQPKPTTVSGNVLSNDTFGSDPASITKIVYLSVTYFPVNGIISIPTTDGLLTLYTMIVGAHQPGDFVFDLTSRIEHPLGQSNNEIQQTFSYTLADIDGDSANANLVIHVIDDVPSFVSIYDPDNNSVVDVTAGNPGSNTTTFIQLADWYFGADGAGSLPSLQVGNGNVVLSSSSNNQVVLNFFDSSNMLVATMTLNADGIDSLELMHRAGTIIQDTLLTGEAKAGGPGVYFVDSSNSPDLTVRITGDDGDGIPEPNSDDQVNPSAQGWAVDNNVISINESLNFEFLDKNSLSPSPISNFSFAATGFTGGESSYDIQVKVVYDGGSLENFNLTVTEGQVVFVDGLPGFNTGSLIDAVEITNVDASAGANKGFRLNGVTIYSQSTEPPPDLDFSFNLNLVDADGDPASQSFNLHLNADNSAPPQTVENNTLALQSFSLNSDNYILDGNSNKHIKTNQEGVHSGNQDHQVTNDNYIVDASQNSHPKSISLKDLGIDSGPKGNSEPKDVLADFGNGQQDNHSHKEGNTVGTTPHTDENGIQHYIEQVIANQDIPK